MKNLVQKLKLRNGSGEIIGFVLILPIVLVLILTILSSTQLSSAQQKLTYSAFTVARAACVSDNQESAKVRIDATLSEIYEGDYTGYRFITKNGSASCPSLNNGQTYAVVQLLGDQWKKGSMLKVTVYQRVTPIMPFSSSIHSQSIAVMIENDVSEAWDLNDSD